MKWVWVHYEDWENFAQIKVSPRHEAKILLNDSIDNIDDLKGSIVHELVHLHFVRVCDLVSLVAENELDSRRGDSLISDLDKAIEYSCEDIAQAVIKVIPCEV